MALRIIFCGTPAFALPSFRLLLAEPDFKIEAVLTQPDRPRGRGQEVSASPVKDAAVDAGIAVYQPEKIKAEPVAEFFRQVAPVAVVIIAYGQIIPKSLLAVPVLGWINLHASLLPKYRGAAPINWAIVNGERRTGVTTMQVEAGLDTGPILMKCETEIGPNEAAPQLAARLAEAGAPLVAETLRRLSRGEIRAELQDDSLATHAPILRKQDGRIDWSLPAQAIYNRIRGLQPWPGAFSTFRGKNCQIWGKPAREVRVAVPPGSLVPAADARRGDLVVACGDGTALGIELVQVEGRKRISAREFASGARLGPGEHFG